MVVAATTGVADAKYDVSFDGSGISLTLPRWLISSMSAAARVLGDPRCLDDVFESLRIPHVAGVQAHDGVLRPTQLAAHRGTIDAGGSDLRPVAYAADARRINAQRLQVRAKSFGDDADGCGATRGPAFGGSNDTCDTPGAALLGGLAGEVMEDQPVRDAKPRGGRPRDDAAAQARHDADHRVGPRHSQRIKSHAQGRHLVQHSAQCRLLRRHVV